VEEFGGGGTHVGLALDGERGGGHLVAGDAPGGLGLALVGGAFAAVGALLVADEEYGCYDEDEGDDGYHDAGDGGRGKTGGFGVGVVGGDEGGWVDDADDSRGEDAAVEAEEVTWFWLLLAPGVQGYEVVGEVLGLAGCFDA
jgi:hypothetical protein